MNGHIGFGIAAASAPRVLPCLPSCLGGGLLLLTGP
ncbi:hypothetical protein EDC22_1114 [Tepidamorphus gemmatus]|jgi:hypothetical protein|uniref:Uncharacterized protein n=1 Tax=Tepidamorphus gemmatus TaxID=747076 RepID=A0A4R3M0B9_9HYPH|nr:hypothetical protein EDC22_1114 [Tepidamorphus gemmatus]